MSSLLFNNWRGWTTFPKSPFFSFLVTLPDFLQGKREKRIWTTFTVIFYFTFSVPSFIKSGPTVIKIIKLWIENIMRVKYTWYNSLFQSLLACRFFNIDIWVLIRVFIHILNWLNYPQIETFHRWNAKKIQSLRMSKN